MKTEISKVVGEIFAKKGGLGFNPKTVTRVINSNELSEITVTDLVKDPNKIVRISSLGMLSICFVWNCLYVWFLENKPGEKEVIRKIKIQITRSRNFYMCGYEALNKLDEAESFTDIKELQSSMSRSELCNPFFRKAFSLAKTPEELFFVVQKGFRSDIWPEAVRKLAKMKDLSPFEGKR